MKAKIAVVTVCGKDYYLVVNELKRRNTPFLSLTPYEPVPIEIEVVITTEKERPLITHQRILTFQEGMRPETLIKEALRIIQGKEFFEKITIGVDPGEVFGLAVLADGKVVETGNCFSLEETLGKIADIVRDFEGTQGRIYFREGRRRSSAVQGKFAAHPRRSLAARAFRWKASVKLEQIAA